MLNSTSVICLCQQQGASDEDIELLPKYKFHRTGNYVSTGDASTPSGGVMSLLNSTPGASGERILQAEDAVIFILSSTFHVPCLVFYCSSFHIGYCIALSDPAMCFVKSG
jgi:hypothetical protein